MSSQFAIESGNLFKDSDVSFLQFANIWFTLFDLNKLEFVRLRVIRLMQLLNIYDESSIESKLIFPKSMLSRDSQPSNI